MPGIATTGPSSSVFRTVTTPILILDNDVTHFFARALGLHRYALISTDYCGGTGSQQAAVYEAGQALMAATAGGINAALRLLGVRRGLLTDEFDTISLGCVDSEQKRPSC